MKRRSYRAPFFNLNNMALIKLGAAITGISGKVGGQTFGQGRSGTYLRNTGKSSASISPSRSNTLFNMSFVAMQWRTLTDAQRTAWNAATVNFPYINRLGETKQYSGYNLFGKFNGNLKSLGETLLLTPPTPYSFSNIEGLGITFTFNQFKPIADATDLNSIYSLFMSPPTSQGVSGAYENMKLIINLAANFGAGEAVINTEIEAVYGNIVLGARYWYRYKVINFTRGIAFDEFFTGFVDT